MTPVRLPEGIEFVDVRYVNARLDDAGKTLMSLPAHGTAPARYRVAWPEMVQAVWDAGTPDPNAVLRPPRPSAQAITDMDAVLFEWVPLVGEKAVFTRRLILLRLLVWPTSERHMWSWKRLAHRMGLDWRTLQTRHARGVDRIVTRLNNPAFRPNPLQELP